jgi:anaerobic selenocysteine-containing dehydrogenase
VTATEWQPTACILCECNCGIEVQLEGRTLSRIRGDKAHPGSQGYTCNKAMRLDHYQNGRHRLRSPLRRRADGTYDEISWDTAIAEIAAGFRSIAAEHGGAKIFYYGGGGQGNHLGGAYSGAFLKALGAKYRSGALAQEKTGEAWVDGQLYGGHTRGEFEHAEVSVFVGKNPWMSQSFPRARLVLREIAKDPERSMIVIDPVLTDTAKMADFHLRVRPGRDAWCLAALAATLVQEDLVDDAFIAEHVTGSELVIAALGEVPIGDYAQRCALEEGLIRAAARRIAGADSVAVFEDLGIQQGPNSTLSSYLNKLLWILTGNFGKPGTQHLHSWMAPLLRSGVVGRTPVTGAPVIGGLTPCNVIPDEILTDHPDRFRAMIVESSNPAHSLADSQRFREAFEALDLLLVIDVAMTETARLADYVLPAASQFEKPEATFFNLEFPRNTFHLRHPLMEPLPGTLPEPEIWARLIRALEIVDDAQLEQLHIAAAEGRQAYAQALMQVTSADPTLARVLPYLLYETLGPTLPKGLHGAAALWGLAQRCAMTYPEAVRRAGHADGDALFDAIIEGRSGVTFTLDEYVDDFNYISHPDKRIALEIPEMLEELRGLADTQPDFTSDEFPVVLAVGERRSYTANDIFRDPSWRKRDFDGALRVSEDDARSLGLMDGGRARITTARGTAEATVEVSDAMLAGHASLPNGYGLDFTDVEGRTRVAGVAPNMLTSADWRDAFAGTPWHKHVPARIEPLAG